MTEHVWIAHDKYGVIATTTDYTTILAYVSDYANKCSLYANRYKDLKCTLEMTWASPCLTLMKLTAHLFSKGHEVGTVQYSATSMPMLGYFKLFTEKLLQHAS